MTKHRRWLSRAVGLSSAAVALLACTITQSLDYLQQGSGTEDVPETGVDGGGGGEAGTNTGEDFVLGQTNPKLLAQDNGALYWVGASAVYSLSKASNAGSVPKSLGAVPSNDAHHLAVDPDPNGSVFVAVGTGVMRFPKDGTGGGSIFQGPNDAPLTDTVAADDSAVFVLQYDELSEDSRVFRMAKDGGGVVDVVDSGAGVMATNSKSVFWFDPFGDPLVFFEQSKTALTGPPIGTYPLGRDEEGPETSQKVVVDEGVFYWATFGDLGLPAIVSLERKVGASVVTLHRGTLDDDFGQVAVDGAHVYFLESRTGTLARVKKEGGDAETLITGLVSATGFVVDATNIYLSVKNESNRGAIRRRAK